MIKRLQPRLDLGAPALEERRQHQLFPELFHRLVDAEAGAVRGDFEQDAVRLAEIEAAEPEAIHLAAVRHAQLVQPLGPAVIVGVRRAERHVMHAAGALARGPQIRLHRDVQLRAGAAVAHLVDVHGILGAFGMRIGAHPAHAHQRGQHRVGRLEVRHAQGDRPEATHLMRRRQWALLPGERLAGTAVVDQAETLAFRVLEIERQASVALGDLGGLHAGRSEMLLPPFEALRAGDAQAGAGDRMRAALLARRRPVEEGEIGAGPGQRIGIEQVIGAGVVLVDGLLDHPHAQRPGIEALVARRVGRDRGQVMDAGELHDLPH